MGDEDGAPGSGDADAGQVHDDVEGVSGQVGVEQDAEQSQRGGDDDAAGGNLVLVEAGRHPWSLTGHRHGAQGAPGGVEAGIERGQRGGEDHDLDDVTGVGNTDTGEEGDKRRLGLRVGRVGEDQCQQHDGADVEDEDTKNHRVDRLGQDFLRVLRLSGGHSYHLRATEGEDDAEGQGEDDRESFGEEASVSEDVMSPCGDRPSIGGCSGVKPENNGDDGHHHEGHDGGDLDECEPELCLSEHLDVQHVEDEDQDECDEREDPLRYNLQSRPVVEVEGHCGDVGHDGHRPVQEEEPSSDIGTLLPEELTGVGDECSGGGSADGELAQCPHHEKREDPADGIGEHQAGSTFFEAAAGTHEKTRADGAADGDHLQVAVLQRLVVTGVAAVLDVIARAGVGGDPR